MSEEREKDALRKKAILERVNRLQRISTIVLTVIIVLIILFVGFRKMFPAGGSETPETAVIRTETVTALPATDDAVSLQLS